MLTNSALLEGELEEKHSEVPGANSQGGQDAIPGPALTAGFASTSDSYKAGLDLRRRSKLKEAAS